MSVLILSQKKLQAAAAAIICRAEINDPAQVLRLCQTMNKIVADNLETYASRYREPLNLEAEMWVHGLTIGGVLEALKRPIITPRQVIKILDCAAYNTTQQATHAIAEALMRCVISPDQDLDHERAEAQRDPALYWG